jgi:hypothetical protein
MISNTFYVESASEGNVMRTVNKLITLLETGAYGKGKLWESPPTKRPNISKYQWWVEYDCIEDEDADEFSVQEYTFYFKDEQTWLLLNLSL